MIRTRLVVGLVLVLALVAGAAALRGGPPPEPEPAGASRLPRPDLVGPDVPAPGLLEGRIVFAVRERCWSIALASLDVERATESEVCNGLLALSERPVAPATSLLVAGEVDLDARDLARGIRSQDSGPVVALGHDERSDGLVAVVVSAPRPYPALPEFALELWRGESMEDAVELPPVAYTPQARPFGEIVRFGPGGREVAVAARGKGAPLVLYSVRARTVILATVTQNGFAWSPDGVWFAVSLDEGIAVHGAERSSPAYVFPFAAEALTWRRA